MSWVVEEAQDAHLGFTGKADRWMLSAVLKQVPFCFQRAVCLRQAGCILG